MNSIISSSIVILGNFNPVIFQTEWFSRFKILPEQEIAATLEEKVVSRPSPNIQIVEGYKTSITPYKTELNFPSFKLLVLPIRFEFSTIIKNCFSELLNSTIKIFELLSHTPINSIGINFDTHLIIDNCDQTLRQLFSASPEKAREAFGESYKVGGKFFISYNDSKTEVVVEPSNLIENGVYIRFNFHREIASRNTAELLSVIRENYNVDLKNADKISKTLLSIKEDIFA
jgi:hypothetical protein